MSLFDIGLLLIIGGFALFGLWFGLVHTLGSLVGSVLGVYLASRYYALFADWLIQATGWSGNFSRVLVFILAFVIINRLVGVVFFLVDKTLSIVTHLPLIHSLDRLLGFIFGLLEGTIVIGIAFYFINKFPLYPALTANLAESKIAPYCIQFASILWPFIPVGVKLLRDTVGI